ncbi:MAG: hypothetical protein JWN78_2113, partial [Bacteroidota bacterium]|nr:hypothetical protein [Bacteroidota bacterium]
MIHKKKIIFFSIIFLPFLLGFIIKEAHQTHPYVWEYETNKISAPEIPADNSMTEEGVELGR